MQFTPAGSFSPIDLEPEGDHRNAGNCLDAHCCSDLTTYYFINRQSKLWWVGDSSLAEIELC